MFEINEKLKSEILNEVPTGLNTLEKALFIYDKLCMMTKYSLDAYLEKQGTLDFFKDESNLSKVDGKDNKEVVCFTFNAIYLELLICAGIVKEKSFSKSSFSKEGKFVNKENEHFELSLMICEKIFNVDSTLGILDKNDLLFSKFGALDCLGWVNAYGVKDLYLNASINKVRKCFSTIRNPFESIDDSIQNLSFSERVEKFLSLSKSAPEYSIETFGYLLQLKKRLFLKSELVSGDETVPNSKISLLFFKEKGTEIYKSLLTFKDEKNKINSIVIDSQNRTETSFSTGKVANMIQTKQWTTRNGKQIDIAHLLGKTLSHEAN